MKANSSQSLPTANKEVLQAEHKRYFTFINLILVLTAVTFLELIVIVMFFFPEVVRLWILIILSIIKFLGVIWWFMHLRWDRFLLTALFLIGLILASGTVAALMLLFEEGGPEAAEQFQV